MTNFIVVTKVEVTPYMIMNAVVGVMEGDYSPWLGNMKLETSANPVPPNTCWYGEETVWAEGFQVKVQYDGPDDEEGSFASSKILTRKEFQDGLQLMAENSASHFHDLITEDDDAITHDILMQYVILGEEIYG